MKPSNDPDAISDDAAPDTQPDGALFAHYRAGERIGEGAIAEVREAIDTRTGGLVALKTLKPHMQGSSELVSRFLREGRALAGIRHANIVKVFDHGVDDAGACWLAMERLRGVSLSALLRREGPLSPGRAIRLATDIAKALATVHHRGLVHRDIKPENVFVVDPGRAGEHAKLLDFGLARVTDSELGEYSVRYTRAGPILGTAAFVAPEQGDGVDLDARADVYAVGVTLYEALTGHLPFDGASIAAQLRARDEGRVMPMQQRVRDRMFEPALVSLVSRCLSRDRGARPSGGLALLRELRALGLEPRRRVATLVPESVAVGLRAGAAATSGRQGLSALVAMILIASIAFFCAALFVARSIHGH